MSSEPLIVNYSDQQYFAALLKNILVGSMGHIVKLYISNGKGFIWQKYQWPYGKIQDIKVHDLVKMKVLFIATNYCRCSSHYLQVGKYGK